MKKALSFVLGLLVSLTSIAQEAKTDTVKTTGKSKDNFSIGIFLGPNYSGNENLDSKRPHNVFLVDKHTVSAGGEIMVAKEFSNIFGWRASAGFFGNKGRANYFDQPEYMGYDFYDAEVFADLTIDLTDWWAPRRKNAFSLKGFLGIGGAYSWGFPDNNTFVKPYESFLGTNGNPEGFDYGARIGLNASWRLSDCWRLGVQLSTTFYDDMFNGYKSDWITDVRHDLFAGLTYTFPSKKKPEVVEEVVPVVPPVEPIYETVNDTTWYDDVEYEDLYADGTMEWVVFYEIRISEFNDPDKQLEEIGKFLANRKDAKVTLKSYADRETGYPRINVGYSKARSEKAVAALKAAGVPESMITAEYFGDTVQPFEENDKNRCTIIKATGLRPERVAHKVRKMRVTPRQVRVN